ncbi:MAG: bifunctional nuclease family protein [Spirochaetales bacterium]|nr:bifunctional nuclease family protein [Spirochaetales bacterium]
MMLIQAEIWTVAKTEQGNAVLLRPIGSTVVVPIFIGQVEAQSILIGMGNVQMPRPNTHELMMNIFREMEIVLEKIEIPDIQDGVFIASLYFNNNNTAFIQDSRPSDALALAVRQNCPIFLADSVIDEAGIPLDSIIEEDPMETSQMQEMEILRLQKGLDKALQEENYEEAARIRDLLHAFEQPDEYPDE